MLIGSGACQKPPRDYSKKKTKGFLRSGGTSGLETARHNCGEAAFSRSKRYQAYYFMIKKVDSLRDVFQATQKSEDVFGHPNDDPYLLIHAPYCLSLHWTVF
jgi:hypothetical protein